MTDFPEFNAEDVEKTEVVEHPPAATERSAARRVALQVLYEVDSTGHDFNIVITSRLQEEGISRKAERYLRRLIKGVLEHRDVLDSTIQRYAGEWPLGQVAIVDRNILRLGIFELAGHRNIPVNVIVSEATELANLYGAEGSTRFVNGVLGALVNSGPEAIQQIIPPQPENEI